MTRRRAILAINATGVLLALIAVIPAAGRALEPSRGTPAPQLAALAPWALPIWVLAGALVLIGPTRGLAISMGIAAVLAAGLALQLTWLIPPAPAQNAAREPLPSGVPFRVMTLNVEYGGADAAQALRLVRQNRVDVLVVEELTPAFVSRLKAAGIGQVLGNSLLHPRARAAGTGIWSRFAMRQSGQLPSEGFDTPMVTITLPGSATGTVTLTGVHCRPPKSDQVGLWRRDLSTLAKVHATAGPDVGPWIYAGDFNASLDHAGFRSVLASGTGLVDAADVADLVPWPGFTWPANRLLPAMTRIDHVLVSPGSIGVRKVTVVSVNGTDHHGVIADLVVSG